MSNNDKLVGVTGAAGYVGAYVVKYLLERGYRVLACVRDPSDESKTAYLRDMDKSEGHKNIQFGGGDLETANYEELFKDCYSIVHIATPYLYTAPDPMNDIVKPAVQGTLRVLQAAAKIASVKSVVITSSAGAVMTTGPGGKEVYDDTCWNEAVTVETHPYFYSKVQAEKAAWQFKKENDANPNSNHFNMSVMNPGFIIGPSYSPNLNTSQKLVLRILLEAASIMPVRAGFIDVRDIAFAHILAIESNTSARYLVSACVKEFSAIPITAQRLFPEIKFNINSNIPTVQAPPFRFDTSKIDALGLTHIDFDQSIKEMINQFIKNDIIKQ